MDMLERAKARQHKLKEFRERLKKDLAEVDSELAALENFFAVAAKLSEDMSPVQRGLPPFPGQSRPRQADDLVVMAAQPSRASGRTVTITANTVLDPSDIKHGEKGRMIGAEAEQIIRTVGPATARGILQIMDQRGTGSLVSGSDEKSRVSYLSAVLSRDDRFESDRSQGGYVLRDTKKGTPHP